MRGLVVFAWLLSLFHYVNAANYYAHVHERIWLSEMYDLFCDIMGPDKQNCIFPKKTKGHKGTRNIGSGPGGRLTYDEFHWRANKGTLGQGIGGPTLAKPWDNMSKAAKDLLDNNMSGNLILEDMDESFNPKKWKADPKDPDAERYAKFIDKVEKQYSEFRADPKNAQHFTEARKARLDELGNRIVKLRRLDGQDWIQKHFKADPPNPPSKPNGGLGLKDIVVESVDTDIDGLKDKYSRLDVAGTLAKYTNADGTLKDDLKKHFPTQQSLIDWVDKQGDPSAGVEYSKPSRSHFRSLTSWTTFQTKQAMSVDQLKSCGSSS